MEGPREERLHLKGSAGVSCSSLEARAANSRDIMKMERTIVVPVVNVLWNICQNTLDYTHCH